MHRKQDLPSETYALAEAQAGVLTTEQLQASDVSEKSVRRMSEAWHSVVPGIWCLQEPTWISAAWAGLLQGGPEAALGSTSAAFVEGWFHDTPRKVVIVTPRRIRPFTIGQWQVSLRRTPRRSFGDLKRTFPEDSILDSARDLTPAGVVHLLARAITARRTTADRVLQAADDRRRQRYRAVIEAACKHGLAGVESILEWRFLEGVVLGHGLPEPTRQVRRHNGTRLDSLCEDFALIVELDGQLGHNDKHRDRRRDNFNMLQYDQTTLRYGWHEVTQDACGVAQQVFQALKARGYLGEMTPCLVCRD